MPAETTTAGNPSFGVTAVCAYVLEDGETAALIDMWLPTARKGDQEAGEPFWVGQFPATQWVVVGGPAAPEFGHWHTSSMTGYSIVLDGAWEIETGNGDRKRLDPGSVLVMLDSQGQGHRSRTVSDKGCTVMSVAVDETTRMMLEGRLKEALAAAQ